MQRALTTCTSIALVWALAAGVLGPSDAWDQLQLTAMAYTTDIIVKGNWVLPREHGERFCLHGPRPAPCGVSSAGPKDGRASGLKSMPAGRRRAN